jgi:pantoate kinase
MAGPNTPTAFAITAALNVVAAQAFGEPAHEITVYNRTGAGEVFLTLDGSTPTVGGANQFYLPGILGAAVVITVIWPNQAENPTGSFPTLKAISAAALSLYTIINQ